MASLSTPTGHKVCWPWVCHNQKAMDPVRTWNECRRQGRHCLVSRSEQQKGHLSSGIECQVWSRFGQGQGRQQYTVGVVSVRPNQPWEAKALGTQGGSPLHPMTSVQGKDHCRFKLGFQTPDINKENLCPLSRTSLKRKRNPLATPNIQDRIFDTGILRWVPFGAGTRLAGRILCTGLQRWQVVEDVLDRGANHLIPILNGVTVNRDLQTRSRVMESFGDVLSRFGHDNLPSQLNKAGRRKNWFLVGLASKDHSLGRPSQGGDNLAGVHIQQHKSKSTCWNKLIGTQVSSSLIHSAQHHTRRKWADISKVDLVHGRAILQGKNAVFDQEFGGIKARWRVRFVGQLLGGQVGFLLTLETSLECLLTYRGFKLGRQHDLKRRTAVICRSFEGSPWLTWSDRLLGGRKSNGLNKEGTSLFDLRSFHTMVQEQSMKTVSRFGVKSSTVNPRPWHAGLGVQMSNKQGSARCMQLESFLIRGGQHLATQHAVDEPQGTNSTKALSSKVPMHSMGSESAWANSSGNGLMQNRKTWRRRPRNIPTGSNRAVCGPSPNERSPMFVATHNAKNCGGLESKATNPLADQAGTGSLDCFGTQQWVHDCPRWLLGNRQDLIQMKPHFIVRPDGALVCKDFLPGGRGRGLTAQSVHQRKVGDRGLRNQQETFSIQTGNRVQHRWCRRVGRGCSNRGVTGTFHNRALGNPRHRGGNLNMAKKLIRVPVVRLMGDPQTQASRRVSERQIQTWAAVKDTDRIKREAQELTWGSNHGFNSVIACAKLHNVRNQIGFMHNRGISSRIQMPELDPRCAWNIIDWQIWFFNRRLRQVDRLWWKEGQRISDLRHACWKLVHESKQVNGAATKENGVQVLLQLGSNPQRMKRSCHLS